MAQQHKTREAIHSGLSTRQEDDKWKSMLNFRSAHNTTRAVPFKKKLIPLQTGFHSLINGLSNWFYSIGANNSHILKGSDSLVVNQLWRGRVEVLVRNKPRPLGMQKLLVRGAFTGSESKRIRVSLSRGQLVTYTVPEIPEEEVEPEIHVDCGVDAYRNRLRLIVQSEDRDYWVPEGIRPIPAARVRVLNGRFLLGEGDTNANGLFDLKSNAGEIKIQISADGYQPKELTYLVEDDEDLQEVVITMKTSIVGWWLDITARAAAIGSPYKVAGEPSKYVASCEMVLNGIVMDILRMEVNDSGDLDPVRIRYEFTQERVDRWLALLGSIDALNVSFTSYGGETGDYNPDLSIHLRSRTGVEIGPTYGNGSIEIPAL